MILVQKFGGSSLADLEKLRRAASVSLEARRRGHSVLVVVSASGDTTDELLELAHRIAPRPPQRELDALMATGEQQSAALMAIMLESLGMPARSFSGWQAGIRTDDRHGGAHIGLLIPERLQSAMEQGQIAVVAGFQGISPAEDITTLGRGGSDTTAVALAAALGAGRCEIYTDVDGIYTADPRLVSGAKLLDEIDFRDMLALARAGSQVLHPESVRLAMVNSVDLWLLSAQRASGGTHICTLPEARRPPLAGITRDAEAGTVTLVGREAGPDAVSSLLSLLQRADIPARIRRAEEGCVSLEVAHSQLLNALTLIHDAVLRE